MSNPTTDPLDILTPGQVAELEAFMERLSIDPGLSDLDLDLDTGLDTGLDPDPDWLELLLGHVPSTDTF